MTERSQLLSQGPQVATTLLHIMEAQSDTEAASVLRTAIATIELVRWDGWNNEVAVHELVLAIPPVLYASLEARIEKIESRLGTKVGRLPVGSAGERLQTVRVCPQLLAATGTSRAVGRLVQERIWGPTGFRLFLSHKAMVKKKAAKLKEDLALYGVAAFVAHEDIHPTAEWQNEIESALATMDAFVALMTPEFHDSLWTDQEVGYALCRGVPMIAVQLGTDPYGFIGKFQALRCDWDEIASELAGLLMGHERMAGAFVAAVQSCTSFDRGNELAKQLSKIDYLTDDQVDALIAAYENNLEVRGSFGFNGTRAPFYGDGLTAHLSRITGRKYVESASGKIRLKT